jgi:class 3 adenylate cyclase/CHASE2 domain-containing sensor protein
MDSTFKHVAQFIRRSFNNTWFAGVFIVSLTTLFSHTVLNNVAIVELAENHLSDLRVALLALPRAQSQRIAVILINEESLGEVSYRSPIDRSLITELINELEIRDVAAIGLNTRFDRSTEPAKDKLLYDRLRNVSVPVVISMVSNKTGYSAEQIEYSRDYLEGLRSGLSLIYRDTIDHTVRVSLLKLPEGEEENLGFTATLAETLGIELPREERIHIDYRHGPDPSTPPFPVYSANQVAELPRSALENRIVLIGPDLGHTRRFRTPLSVMNKSFAKDLPGVVIEAHVLSQLIENRSLNMPLVHEKIFFILLMASTGFLLSLVRVNLLIRLLIPIALLLFAWMSALLVFILYGAIVPIVTPTIAFILAIIISAFWQWRNETIRRDQVHRTFGQFLAPTVVAQMLKNPGELELSGEVREMSFLFTDLEGFTRLTESTQPKVMVDLVNRYLEEACDIVMAHDGTIDKIVGDALHVMFNAPLRQVDHAQRAVNCALELDEWSREFRRRERKKGLDLGATRIGINTGNCIVGNFGGKKRFDYTAHGDAINSAARLEAINQRLGTTICVSEATVNQCKGIYFRSVATLVLRGKTNGIKTYMPVRNGINKTHGAQYEKAYQLLSDEDPDSTDLFGKLAAQYPQDPLVCLHASRIEAGEHSTTLIIRKK